MTWTAPGITRARWPPASLVAGERTLAGQWLGFHRQTLLWKCGGLTGAQLKLRNIQPSNISLLGLVRHMAEVERDWFRTRFAGDRPEPERADEPALGVFDHDPGARPAQRARRPAPRADRRPDRALISDRTGP
jgi:Protein of unknown function (DUF664)